jgi:hypothetical protein
LWKKSPQSGSGNTRLILFRVEVSWQREKPEAFVLQRNHGRPGSRWKPGD